MAHFGSRLDVDLQGGIYVRKMAFSDPYVIMTEYGYLTIYDATDPANLVPKDRQAILANVTALGMLVEHPLIYLCGINSLFFSVFDMTDPAALVMRDGINLAVDQTGALSDIAKSGNYCYIPQVRKDGTFTHIAIVNVADPDNISEETLFTDATNLFYPSGVAIDITGNYLFVALPYDFAVYDISTKTAPVFSNKVTITSCVADYSRIAITADGKYAYVTRYQTDEIDIIDVTDPTNVSKVATLTDATYLDGIREIQVVDDAWLYGFSFSAIPFYMSVWDIDTNPASPSRVESLNLTTDDPWSGGDGRIGGFVVDDYENLYVGKYTTSASKGIASYGIDQPPPAVGGGGNPAHQLLRSAFI